MSTTSTVAGNQPITHQATFDFDWIFLFPLLASIFDRSLYLLYILHLYLFLYKDIDSDDVIVYNFSISHQVSTNVSHIYISISETLLQFSNNIKDLSFFFPVCQSFLNIVCLMGASYVHIFGLVLCVFCKRSIRFD